MLFVLFVLWLHHSVVASFSRSLALSFSRCVVLSYCRTVVLLFYRAVVYRAVVYRAVVYRAVRVVQGPVFYALVSVLGPQPGWHVCYCEDYGRFAAGALL